ncbi:DUF6345 domain-containing protein [Paraliomyxa miuraensis]|uniref:DUF6345 domain-containing protein n=1 Tax=Paraliomyxa miuraensis TaxID=376150 RepID=UPI0022512513|nr:hypothetical protein [Paraliomyxa miuraensis]MCX4239353.1 hypothetical protein [Paraliomyxa miuraensis]
MSSLGVFGCPGVPPTTGGTTDVSATDGAQGAEISGGQAGVDETGTGGGEPFDHRTYFIGESVKFDGGGDCDNDNLNTITRSLRTRLDGAGWTGLRFVDDNAWPEDFWEASMHPNGADGTFGDAHRLAIYAGHGGPGFLQWGRPSDHGECFATIPVHSRLGQLAGDTAAAVMLMTSCTLRTDVLWDNFELNAARQFFGYHNSPWIGGGEPRRVFKRTEDGQSTKDAWLDEMEQNADLGKNSPVVLTAGVSGMEAMQAHGATNLASGAGFIDNVGEPADAFFFEWLNNGCTALCGGCSRVAPAEVPSMLVGAKIPIVGMERPRRSAEALVDRASTLVAVLQGEPVRSVQRARLEEWAQAILASQDVTVTTLPGKPAIQVAYEPSIDRLVVDDLDARAAARPSASESVDDGKKGTELEKAGKARDQALSKLSATMGSALVGLPTEPTFSLTTREAGLIERGGTSTTGSIPFEYIFSTFGVFASHPVFDARLELGITRHGTLSRIAVSALAVSKISSASITRSPEEALRTLERDIEASNPKMIQYEITAARVGLAFPSGSSSSALASPELFADYVVAYPGNGTTPAVSRRQPVSLSLIAPSAPMLRADPDGATDDLGDLRHEAPARPVRR